MDIPTTMCRSKDLIKKDGVYTCEYCGAKYTAEEAKKLMIEGTVDVSGSTVKADTSDELSNLYQLAHRVRANDDDATASKYYDMILLKAPNSWEAIFYSLYIIRQLRQKLMKYKPQSVRSITMAPIFSAQ